MKRKIIFKKFRIKKEFDKFYLEVYIRLSVGIFFRESKWVDIIRTSDGFNISSYFAGKFDSQEDAEKAIDEFKTWVEITENYHILCYGKKKVEPEYIYV